MEDGNVIKLEDGYSTQDAQYTNRLKDMSALKRYFYNEFIKGQYDSYAGGGKAIKEYVVKGNVYDGGEILKETFDNLDEAIALAIEIQNGWSDDGTYYLITIYDEKGKKIATISDDKYFNELTEHKLFKKVDLSAETKKERQVENEKLKGYKFNLQVRIASYPDNLTIFDKTFDSIFDVMDEMNTYYEENYYAYINNKDLDYWEDKYYKIDEKRNYIKGKYGWSFFKQGDIWIAKDDYEDTHIVRFVDGKPKSKSSITKGALKQIIELQNSNKYADGGSTDDKHLVAKAIEYITGYAVDTDSIVEKDLRYNFKYKNRNVSSSLNSKLVHDTIRMNKKSLESRYTQSLATKYAKGGKANTDIFDYDEKMALINLGQVYEYAIKLDKMIKDDTDLEEWVKMKLTRIEQNISDVKHSLEGWEKYKKGGEIAKKQLLHIAKYSKDLIEMIQGGSRLMSWQEDKLAVSSQSIDDIYHHLDYKMGNRAEDLDVDNEYATGGEAGFDDAGTSMVMYHEKKGNFFIPKGQVYLWLYDVEDSGEKINSEEYDYVMYPVATQSMAWQSGFIPPLKKIWTKKFQKTHKGSEHLLGVIKAYLIEEEGKKELFIDMMSVNPTKKKKGIMSYMIKDLRDTFKLTQDQVTFSGLTPEGEKFIAKKTYADGGEVNDLENYINIDKMNPNQYEIVKNFNTLKSLAKNGFIELHEKTGLRYKNYQDKAKSQVKGYVTNVRHDYIKSATSPKFEFNNRNFAIGYIKGLNFEELYVLEDMSNK
jgi:hypothetical protein